MPWSGFENLTSEQQREEDILLALRMNSGFDIAHFEKCYGINIDRKLIKRLISGGLLEKVRSPKTATKQGLQENYCDDHRVRPTLKGRLLNDSIIMQIIRQIDPE